ncbi:hypothetical protein AK812_SmicGene17825 [Symbiodinium microadriaticum]|uniref:Uncharacterized protein n=1 Tax=Symbiodinium microadriaticum TaxID=2951 RepID=A0A1Q9DWQ2_SYMMI|nr:hypothetical protein AK812_SmicGene17825 [Symbiodinium microadriaticum]
MKTYQDVQCGRGQVQIKRPLVWPLDFEERRSCEGAEVLEPDSTRDSLPVALQKRYEEKAYHKIMNEVEGSGNTGFFQTSQKFVLHRNVIALLAFIGIDYGFEPKISASCEEFQKRVGVLAASTMGVFMEFYRRENREASIPRQLFPQPTGSSKQPGIELGVVREEERSSVTVLLPLQERKQFRPPPSSIWVLEYHCIQSSDFQIRVITNWNALLRMLDNSVKGDNTMAARGGAFLQAVEEAEPYSGLAFPFLPARDTFTQGPSRCQEERFDMPEEGGGGGLFDQDRYDEFEQLMGGKLMGQHLDKSKGDTLFGAYREFLTVIAGSPRAARSRDGTLSREEYVSDRDAQGKPIPELRESAYRGSEEVEKAAQHRLDKSSSASTTMNLFDKSLDVRASSGLYSEPFDGVLGYCNEVVPAAGGTAHDVVLQTATRVDNRIIFDIMLNIIIVVVIFIISTIKEQPLEYAKPSDWTVKLFMYPAYRAWKKSEHRTDAARNILRRAEKEGMKDPVRKCRPQVLSMGG